ncbi:hypothetical protein CRE_08602 [Caenorhabditis remanei]|uniref:Uncharacterized protein n=2 Tax=Caenorhabditis remanei TaxID=31234 RepID=E3NJJ3_CAERE|nr:hypothetical protein CRE_08602 [Caenorhabditis remanei]
MADALNNGVDKSGACKPNPLLIWRENRNKYLAEKAKTVRMPTDESTKLNPVFMFDDPVFMVHMCAECRKLNRSGLVTKTGTGHQQVCLKLCNICCAMFNAQRRTKFFNHDLLCFKRGQERGNSMEPESTLN